MFSAFHCCFLHRLVCHEIHSLGHVQMGGGIGAIGLALIFTCIYVGSFFVITKKWARHEQYVSLTTLKLIWALGFVQLAVLGTFYHLLPQFFPAIIADFFFA